jgi:hypothetical protein
MTAIPTRSETLAPVNGSRVARPRRHGGFGFFLLGFLLGAASAILAVGWLTLQDPEYERSAIQEPYAAPDPAGPAPREAAGHLPPAYDEIAPPVEILPPQEEAPTGPVNPPLDTPSPSAATADIERAPVAPLPAPRAAPAEQAPPTRAAPPREARPAPRSEPNRRASAEPRREQPQARREPRPEPPARAAARPAVTRTAPPSQRTPPSPAPRASPQRRNEIAEDAAAAGMTSRAR